MHRSHAARSGSLLLAAALAVATGATMQLGPASAVTADGHRDVLVVSAMDGVGAVAAGVRAAGGTVRAVLPLAGGVHALLPAGAVLPASYTVVGNAPLQVTGAGGLTGADREATAVREALGLEQAADQGAGVRIAVVDTGVADSPDLGARLSHHDVSGTWQPGEARDAHGHGTFVAGIAAGSGTASGGRWAGVAPGAQVLDVRVADDDGATDLATVLLGLERAADLGADVVNLSLSSGSPLPWQVDPLTVALDRLWAAGTVVVVPTGNDGPGQGSVTSPGTDPTLLTVGALDENLTADRGDDRVPSFSGRGPAPQGVAKPDLVAPGRSLVSLRAPGSVVDVANPGSAVERSYFRGSGSSFATAAVSGAAAVLLQGRPGLSPDQVKQLVRATAYSAKGLDDVRAAGAGGLDLRAALQAQAPQAGAVQADVPPAGEDAAWDAFAEALLSGDRPAADAAWARLSPAAHRWVAHRWVGVSPQAHRWVDRSWSAHRWTSDGGADGESQARAWAAHRWVAHRWVAHRWVGDGWAAGDLSAQQWATQRWSAHRWVDEQENGR